MNNLLKGKKGIIFGALDEKSIAWKVAEESVKNGANIVLTNAPTALRLGSINKLAEKCKCEIIPADATKIEDLENLLDKSMSILSGKVDFILHSIGMSLNVRKKRHYTDLNYDYLIRGFDISALSFHKLLQTAMKKDAINDWGSVLALSYIAAQKTFPSYNDMAENKSYLESIARSFGYHYGKNHNIRVNTIHPDSVYDTDVWSDDILKVRAKQYGLSISEYKRRNLLKTDVSSEDVAELVAFLASSKSSKTTGAQIPVDGGNDRII